MRVDRPDHIGIDFKNAPVVRQQPVDFALNVGNLGINRCRKSVLDCGDNEFFVQFFVSRVQGFLIVVNAITEFLIVENVSLFLITVSAVFRKKNKSFFFLGTLNGVK